MQTTSPSKATTQATIRKVRNLLVARRNGNVIREQAEWERLYAWCLAHNLAFEQTIDDVTRWLRTHDVAAIMGGEV